MIMKRIKSNFGFLIAGAILFAVAINVYYEINSSNVGESKCPCILTQ